MCRYESAYESFNYVTTFISCFFVLPYLQCVTQNYYLQRKQNLSCGVGEWLYKSASVKKKTPKKETKNKTKESDSLFCASAKFGN